MELVYSALSNVLPFSWIQFNFMKNAFLAILLISPLFGIIGTMVVNNKLSFFSDALGHSALTGIAIGVMCGINNYIISMIAFSMIFAYCVAYIINSSVTAPDTIIGVFSSIGIATGIIILSHNGGFSKYSSYLIGDLLSISKEEILMLATLLVFVLMMWSLVFNKLMLASLNTDLALSKRINVKFYKTLFMLLVAVIVTVSVKWVGILIVNSLLVLPAAAARNIAKNMRMYHIITVLISVFSSISGLIFSYYWGTSSGSTIVLITGIIFFITFFINKLKNLHHN